jgi:cyclic nucleotide gated channel
LREYKSFIDEQVRDKMEREEEERGSVISNTAQVKQNLGVTILASRFAANTRKGVQKIKDVEMLKLQKPEEPDFSVEPEDD